MTQELPATSADPDRARTRPRAALSERDTGDGVRFDSNAWLVSAHRQ